MRITTSTTETSNIVTDIVTNIATNLNESITINHDPSSFLEWIFGDWGVKDMGTSALRAVKSFPYEREFISINDL